jgi:cobalt/nickel transport system permease protein
MEDEERMHMSDALVAPVVGAALWAGAAAAAAYSVRKISKDDLIEGKKVPLMGVMGAFVFAAQMLNFTIPGTGSSGHIGGGMLLAAMLGPQAGFLTMVVILAIQALFFADGGLLALGCNIINLGFFSCFIAYPLIFRPLVKRGASTGRIALASVLSSVAALQMGAFAVVLETLLSGRTELPFGPFALLMQPIHLAIGLVEGGVTAAVLVFLHRMEPQSVAALQAQPGTGGKFPKRTVAVVAALALLCAGLLSWFASNNPDGLEWSMLKIAGTAELSSSDAIHQGLSDAQQKTSLLPGYNFKTAEPAAAQENAAPAGTNAHAGTSAAGITGSLLTLALAAVVGVLLYLPKRKKKRQAT